MLIPAEWLGCSVVPCGRADAANGAGWTALHVAAKRGHVKAIRALTKYGATVDARDLRYDGTCAPPLSLHFLPIERSIDRSQHAAFLLPLSLAAIDRPSPYLHPYSSHASDARITT